MSSFKIASALALVFAALGARAATYNLVETSQGDNFFGAWELVTGYDNTTTGDVIYANNASLAYVENGQAILRVASNFVPYNEKRESVKIQSQRGWGLGTLAVLDASHLPVGCSVWPAWYTIGYDTVWPAGGEIDVIEMQNLAGYNQMSLHTQGTCTQPSGVTQSGTNVGRDCSVTGNQNQGCPVQDTRATAYGSGMNAAGGGTWALEMADAGISMWYFPRGSAPSSLSGDSQSADPTTWGTPVATYPSSSCAMSNFARQRFIITTTLCGQWAGVDSVYLASGCSFASDPSQQSCYTTNVINNGSAAADYPNAYWAINSFRVFSSVANGNVSGTVDPSLGRTSGGGSAPASLPSATASQLPGSGKATGAASILGVALAPVAALFLAVLTLA